MTEIVQYSLKTTEKEIVIKRITQTEHCILNVSQGRAGEGGAYKTVPYSVKGSTGSASIDACELKIPAMVGTGGLCECTSPLACAGAGSQARRAAVSTAGAAILHGENALV